MTDNRWTSAYALAAVFAAACGSTDSNMTAPGAVGAGPTAVPMAGLTADSVAPAPSGVQQPGPGAAVQQPGLSSVPGSTAVAAPASAATGGVAAPADTTTQAQGTPQDAAAAPVDDAITPADMQGMDPTAEAGAAMGTDALSYPDPRGQCDINSGYAGDEACLLPPDPSEGMQIHIGPKSYDDPNEIAPFLMMPGGESSECWTFHTPNDEEIAYQTFVLSGRPGTHHIINTMYRTQLTDGGFSVCADPGTGANGDIIDNLPGASKPYMPRGVVAPEDANLGRLIPARAAAQADMHYFNTTDKPIIREFWMNIYFVDKSKVTDRADQIRAMGGIGWTAAPIPPGTDEVFKYECPVRGNGRILSLLGHYHAHGKHFTASIRRKATGNVEKVFEMYDYLEPAAFEYNSVLTNPEFSEFGPGAVSGLLEVSDGDVVMWDCHIQNDSPYGLTYTNSVERGEMCNLWGSSVGIEPMNCLIPF